MVSPASGTQLLQTRGRASSSDMASLLFGSTRLSKPGGIACVSANGAGQKANRHSVSSRTRTCKLGGVLLGSGSASRPCAVHRGDLCLRYVVLYLRQLRQGHSRYGRVVVFARDLVALIPLYCSNTNQGTDGRAFYAVTDGAVRFVRSYLHDTATT